MTLEIHNPTLVERVNEHLKAGHAHDVDDLFEKALDAFDQRSTTPTPNRDTRTGADLIAALQSSPHRELEIEPPRVRLTKVRGVLL